MPGADDKKKDDQSGTDDQKKKDQQDQTDDTTGADDGEGDDGEGDFSDPEKVKAEIKKLRAEAAKHRNKAKAVSEQLASVNGKMSGLKKALGVEDENEDPEAKLKAQQAKSDALEVELSVVHLARDHEVPKESEQYFRFLLGQKLESLEEGEELSDEQVEELAAEAKKVSGKPANNSTGLGGGKKPPADNGKGALTVEQFVKLNTGEKSAIYAKNPSEYSRLFSEAREKRLL